MSELLYQIALTKIPLVGAKNAKTLIAYCGSIEAIFAEKKKNLLKIPNIGEVIVQNIQDADPIALASEDLEYIVKNKIGVSFFLEDAFPSRLKHYDDSPILFYYKGQAGWNHHRTVAIVGTRQPTPYGEVACSELLEKLAEYDIHVFSGLAHGVDSHAHNKCLELNIPNSAVMGTGIDTIYPAAHRRLSEKITDQGALITEFPIKSRVDSENFPRRNRIIAALSDVVIVIESAAKGGSLITAEFANAYNKDVFAFPGRTTDKSSVGCNRLIKNNQAHLLESARDIIRMMRWESGKPKHIQPLLFEPLEHEEIMIIGMLRQHEHVHIDVLHATLDMNLSTLSSHLLQLEFKGLVKSLPGKRYMAI